MLQILVEKMKPSTRVGIFALKDKIRTIGLVNFNHNVGDVFQVQVRHFYTKYDNLELIFD